MWSLGCVLYELCALRHPVLLPPSTLHTHCFDWRPLSKYCQWIIVYSIRADILEHSERYCEAVVGKRGRASVFSWDELSAVYFCGSAVAARFVFPEIFTHLIRSLLCQFQAPSWKTLILKVCRGSYPPLPDRLPYELHYLIKHMFKTNPKNRPSLHTILTSHRISRLLHKHLPSQVIVC